MTKKLAAIALLIVLAVVAAFGQVPFLGGMPVFDATNFGNAIKRHVEMIKQYEQLVLTYEQLILEYEHFLWMAKQLPGLPRHALSYTPWRYSSSSDVYGTSGGWTQAINTGGGVIPGYRRATEPLRTFGAALANIPANQVERVKTDYATVELTDAANLHGIEVLGLQRAKAKANERAILELEAATLSTADEMNTQIAVLKKINAAVIDGYRHQQLAAQDLTEPAGARRRRVSLTGARTDDAERSRQNQPEMFRCLQWEALDLQLRALSRRPILREFVRPRRTFWSSLSVGRRQ